ncbi:MAG: TIGR02452 family protein, partial [Clostridia bacterium]|nr:TIGR02452 family protein [Clostridia bacterium]
MSDKNITMLQETLEILEKGSYPFQGKTVSLKLSYAQREEAQVFLPPDVRRICQAKDFSHVYTMGRCGYGVENADSFALARKRIHQFSSLMKMRGTKPVLVLNLANPVSPGGGVRHGARAQEEDLCRKSSLLQSLESREAKVYYDYNRSLHSDLGSDAVMISPQVEIIRDENGDLLEETSVVAVMTCAAPILTKGHYFGLSNSQYETLMLRRITGMLKVAAYLGYEYLVLGAFGCGAFENDAKIVSDLFYKALKEFDFDGMQEKDMFCRIDFAVLCPPDQLYNYREFSRNFDHFYRDEDQEEINMALERI